MDDQHLESNNLLADEESLTLPHFEDEATVQSARPVVPLHEVRKASRSKRRVILGAALCLSAFVGAVAASLVYSHHAQQVEESATTTTAESAQESSPGFIAPSGEASGAIVDPEEALAADTGSATVNRSDDIEVQTSTAVSRQPVRNSRVPKSVERIVSPPEPPGREADDEEMRREERREARRLRRERRVERRSGEGLTRIREIFEGSPRP